MQNASGFSRRGMVLKLSRYPPQAMELLFDQNNFCSSLGLERFRTGP
jgi:hypothetical protein